MTNNPYRPDIEQSIGSEWRQPQPEPAKEPGQVAYEAFYESTGGWSECIDGRRAVWRAVESAVLEAAGVERLRAEIVRLKELVDNVVSGEEDERERAETAEARLKELEAQLDAVLGEEEEPDKPPGPGGGGTYASVDVLSEPFVIAGAPGGEAMAATETPNPVLHVDTWVAGAVGAAVKAELPGGHGPTHALEQSIVDLASLIRDGAEWSACVLQDAAPAGSTLPYLPSAVQLAERQLRVARRILERHGAKP